MVVKIGRVLAEAVWLTVLAVASAAVTVAGLSVVVLA